MMNFLIFILGPASLTILQGGGSWVWLSVAPF